jgi:hypothetical protein
VAQLAVLQELELLPFQIFGSVLTAVTAVLLLLVLQSLLQTELLHLSALACSVIESSSVGSDSGCDSVAVKIMVVQSVCQLRAIEA